MDNPGIWEHEYISGGQKKKYKVELINFPPNDDNPDDPSRYLKIRPELDKQINTFLDAYHINPLIPMRLEISGKSFQVAMGPDEVIQVEKLVEDSGHQGQIHIYE